MRIKSIIVKNFRGYSGEHKIDIEKNITALIGKNDAGKSTLLEALSIFYGESKPDLADLNIYATDREMYFGVVFSELPEQIKIDTTAATNLHEEYLINEDGDFEVVMKYTATASTLGTKPEKVIRCLHPTAEGFESLLNLKLTELKSKGKELGVGPDDERVNNLWRKAIWASAGNLETRKLELNVDNFDSKVKTIYANIESLFPQYYLFRVDRQTSDGDAEAKDPMQLAVKEAQKEYQSEIQSLQAKIQERVDQVAERALERLHEMDKSLASQLKPALKGAPKWSFDYRINDDRGISLNKRGSGTRRLVLLNFFRAEAERKSGSDSGSIIYAIEEPETSQHPNNQSMIMDSLLDLSLDRSRQVIVTSHSPQLVQGLPHDSVKFIEFDKVSKNTVVETGKKAIVKAAESLGIHSKQKFGSAEALILVEGKDDELFLAHASKMLAQAGDIPHDYIAKGKIQIVSAGGCDNVSFWLQKQVLETIGLPYCVFLDSDRTTKSGPQTKNEKLVADMLSSGLKAYCTRKREVENYIDPALTKGAIFGEFDDAKKSISQSDSLKYRKGKPRKVLETHWPNMTRDQIVLQSKYIDSNGKTQCEILDIISEANKLLETAQ